MPLTTPGHNWDVDVDFGRHWEKEACRLLEGHGRLEVKADRLWHRTGNLAFERRYRGHPSGLSITEADWWVTVLTSPKDPMEAHCIMLHRPKALKRILNNLLRRGKASKLKGGDGGKSELVVVNVGDLARAI
tara:strand:+ start:275 stop:670 length:396 start_codon:yes stop_codon:yes gene_type:complete